MIRSDPRRNAGAHRKHVCHLRCVFIPPDYITFITESCKSRYRTYEPSDCRTFGMKNPLFRTHEPSDYRTFGLESSHQYIAIMCGFYLCNRRMWPAIFLLLVVTMSWSRSMPALLITTSFVAWSRHEKPWIRHRQRGVSTMFPDTYVPRYRCSPIFVL